jgi:glutathione S-transferase
MDLYFSPLACSLASRIALYEAQAPAHFIEVDAKSKRTLHSDESFYDVHALGLVPALRTETGEILTENAAVLQHIADAFPDAQLAPAAGFERSRLQEWLCFIGTELHKGLFVPLLDERASEAVKQYALERYLPRLDHLERRLQGREFALDRFGVADAYLFVVLSWSVVTPIKLSSYPAIHSYLERLRKRPSIARAFSEELVLFQNEQARHGKPPLKAAAAHSLA